MTASQSWPAPDAGQRLTTNQGVPVANNQDAFKVGLRGPTAMEDFILREKITHFDHERIPERVVHARGSAAHGYFESYQDLSAVTRAAPFAAGGKRTPVFVRFSTVAGERGSANTVRDVCGFAVKFYTSEGNWDLVGNNIPVFFIQDAMKFPDLIHAVKPESHNGMPQAASAHDTFWDFVTLTPESTHMLMWHLSDRAIPRSYRTMQGFGVHTFRLVNAHGVSVFCKFHWNPVAGTHSLVWDEAARICGADADFHRRDLWEAIESGNYPEWELGLQIFSEEQAAQFPFDVLDPTKIVPEELVPVRPVGKMTLDRNPDNFFAGTEQVAFCSAHVIPGTEAASRPAADKVRGKSELFADHYSQARLFWISQSPAEQAHIEAAYRFELNRVQTPAIRARLLAMLAQVDPVLAAGVADGLGMEPPPAPPASDGATPQYPPSPALSLLARPGRAGIAGRRIAILATHGVEPDSLQTVYADLLEAGAVPRVVSPQLGRLSTTDGAALHAETSIEAGPSVLYDAVIVADGAASAAQLAADADALEFVRLQYRHCKPLLALGAGSQLLERAGLPLPAAGARDGAREVDTALWHAGGDDIQLALAAFCHALSGHRDFGREGQALAL